MPDEPMLICPSCGEILEPNSVKCSRCGLEFPESSSMELDLEKESDELVRLLSLHDSMEAHMIRMFLEDEGIPCILSEGGVTSVLGAISPIDLMRVKILVPKNRAKDAVIALQKYNKWDEQQLNRYLTMLDEL